MRRLTIRTGKPDAPFTLWNLGPQPIPLAFDGGRIVSDAGLLAVRALEKPLGVLADVARRLPDPRAAQDSEPSVEALLTQAVYQLGAGYPDPNDAQELRQDPLFQILADVAPDADNPLASGRTLARFPYAYTRRQAEIPLAERPVLLEQRVAPCQRLPILTDCLVELVIRTRRTPPTAIILAADASDDPVHGHQALRGYHGSYRQHPQLPWFVSDGGTGFPRAAWLRPGTVPASLGAADILDGIVRQLRAAWPGVRMRVRSDNGLAVPGLYDSWERHGLPYALGYASNAVRQRATAQALADVALSDAFQGHREPVVQRCEALRDYQADRWPHPRRIVAQSEVTPQGSQRRFVVTNLDEPAAVVYRDVYIQRGGVPEHPIGARKKGLQADRLSACGFCANAFRLLVPTLAYALVVRFREAAGAVPEVATATVSTLRQRWWQVGAGVGTGVRRIGFHRAESWPGQAVWGRLRSAVRSFVAQVQGEAAALRPTLQGSPR